MAHADGARSFTTAQNARAAFVRNGDIFVRDLKTAALQQITRTPQDETAPQFSADGRLLSFRSQNAWYVHDLASGVTADVAELKTEKDPNAAPKAGRFARHAIADFLHAAKKSRRQESRARTNETMQRDDVTRAK